MQRVRTRLAARGTRREEAVTHVDVFVWASGNGLGVVHAVRDLQAWAVTPLLSAPLATMPPEEGAAIVIRNSGC